MCYEAIGATNGRREASKMYPHRSCNHCQTYAAGRRRPCLPQHSMTSMLHPRVAPLDARHAADTVGHWPTVHGRVCVPIVSCWSSITHRLARRPRSASRSAQQQGARDADRTNHCKASTPRAVRHHGRCATAAVCNGASCMRDTKLRRASHRVRSEHAGSSRGALRESATLKFES